MNCEHIINRLDESNDLLQNRLQEDTMRKVDREVLRSRTRCRLVVNRIFLPLAGVAIAAYALRAQTPPQVLSAQNVPPRSIEMTELKSRHLFAITMTLPPILELGDTPAGHRRVFTVSGGEFAGDRLRGEVLPQAGSDLLLVRADGSSQQDVRLILRTDDGALILMTYRGVRHASPEVTARIARGERVARSDYYLRTAPFFETSSPKYAWLNKIVSVGIGERRPDGVTYDVFEVL
jgi:hypothetical protein